MKVLCTVLCFTLHEFHFTLFILKNKNRVKWGLPVLRNLAESQMLNIAFLVSYCELWEDFTFKVRSVAQPCWDFSRIFRCSLTMHWGYWNFPTKNSKILKSVMQCQLEVETGGHRLTLATGSCCPSFLLDCMQLQCFLSCLVILHKILSSILEEAKGH